MCWVFALLTGRTGTTFSSLSPLARDSRLFLQYLTSAIPYFTTRSPYFKNDGAGEAMGISAAGNRFY